MFVEPSKNGAVVLFSSIVDTATIEIGNVAGDTLGNLTIDADGSLHVERGVEIG